MPRRHLLIEGDDIWCHLADGGAARQSTYDAPRRRAREGTTANISAPLYTGNQHNSASGRS